MAIQMRRGQLADFNPDKMLPGEWAVSTDSTSSNQHVYMCFAPGVVKRMATYEDFEDDMEALSTAIQTANAAAAAANQAAQDVAQIIAEKFGIDDTTPSTTTAYSSSKVESTFSKIAQLSREDFPETGDGKTLYIDTGTGRSFYWTASGYAQIDGDAAYIIESAVSAPEEEAAPSQFVNANGSKKYPISLTNGVYRVDGTLLETLLANTVDKLKDVATSGKASDVSLSPISGMEATTVQEGVSELNSNIETSLTAETLSSGSILDAVLAMGNNVHRIFVADPYFPPDNPKPNAELAIDIIKQYSSGRILVVAWEYSGGYVCARQLFNDAWFGPWKSVNLTII